MGKFCSNPNWLVWLYNCKASTGEPKWLCSLGPIGEQMIDEYVQCDGWEEGPQVVVLLLDLIGSWK